MNTTDKRPARSGMIGLRILLMLIASLPLGAIGPGLTDTTYPKYASRAVDLNNPDSVDVALVLAVDVSSSIKSDERRFQREAYARALSDPRVATMALGGGAGRVAIAYMEWSGRRYQRVHLPIRVLSTPEELSQFAEDILLIEDQAADPMYLQPTAVGNALLAAEAAMAALQVPARDYIIDISGDGVVNDGTAVLSAREHLLAQGLTVNGLPIEVSGEVPVYEDMPQDQVTRFYADCVIGGPGSFHVVARGFDDVREALIMKLMLEMADMRPTEKRRLAAAWNGRTRKDELSIVPATVLQLTPPAGKPRQQSDCGEMQVRAGNPFQHR